MLAGQSPSMNDKDFLELQGQASQVHVSDALADYVQALLAASREMDAAGGGLSPRAGLGLLNAARAWSLIEGRDMVVPEDVQAVFAAVAGHRLRRQGGDAEQPGALAERILHTVLLG